MGWIVIRGKNKETGENGKFKLKLPTTPDEVKEITGIDAELYELEIIEHTYPFEIGEVMWLCELNKISNLVDEFENDPRLMAIKEIANEWYGSNVMAALAEIKEIRYQRGVESCRELADRNIKSTKSGTYIFPFMRQFFDVSAYANYLETEGSYVFVNGHAFYQKRKTKENEN